MNLVAINYNNGKAGRVLALTGISFLLPFAMYSFLPGFFATTNNNLFELLLKYSFFGFWAFAAGSVSIAIVKKLLSNEAAIALSEKGIRSNASGFTVKSIPLCDIDKATITSNHRGGIFLHVHIKKEASAKHSGLTVNARWFNAQPAIRIFCELLEGSPEDIANTINQYIENANTADASNDIDSSAPSKYLNKAA